MKPNSRTTWFWGVLLTIGLATIIILELKVESPAPAKLVIEKADQVQKVSRPDSGWYKPTPEAIASAKQVAAENSKQERERRLTTISVGMSKQAVYGVLGNPDRTNASTYAWGTKTQAVYDPPVHIPGTGNINYVYFEDRLCTSFDTTSEYGRPAHRARASSTTIEPKTPKGDRTTVRKGMTIKQVYAALGKPTKVDERQANGASIVEAFYKPAVESTNVGFVAVVYFVNGVCRSIETSIF